MLVEWRDAKFDPGMNLISQGGRFFFSKKEKFYMEFNKKYGRHEQDLNLRSRRNKIPESDNSSLTQ